MFRIVKKIFRKDGDIVVGGHMKDIGGVECCDKG